MERQGRGGKEGVRRTCPVSESSSSVDVAMEAVTGGSSTLIRLLVELDRERRTVTLHDQHATVNMAAPHDQHATVNMAALHDQHATVNMAALHQPACNSQHGRCRCPACNSQHDRCTAINDLSKGL